MFRILFYRPEIPGNTGNAIRLAANTGCELHLVEPLGFSMEAAQLRRAGLDYHDLAVVRVHSDLATAWRVLLPAKVYAFTTGGTRRYT
ncbi:MAG: tRNA (cytidine(34)-2'-O)-methyltransferase, partial [Mycobacteriales bacterium]